MQRRLAAIVAADIAGFSRLVGLDEEGTLAALRLHRAELIDPLLSRHRGRVANTAGDSLLIEFPSAVEAVRCALAVQEGMAERAADAPEDRRIAFRVGVNVGDVVAEGDDLLGDGVNVAARLEALAPPGGIVLSVAAKDQIAGRLDLRLADLGEIALKNIERPVRAWQALRVGEAPIQPPAAVRPSENPSIAVLPFDDFGAPDQSWFADGMVEDVITALAHQPMLDVIARNTTFIYKGRAVDVAQVGRELNVRYVLEGSVRRAGDRLRVTAQLIEAVNGAHIWAERYDRNVEDVFNVQDELTEAVSAAVLDPIHRSEMHRAVALGSRDLTVRSLFWQAWDGFCESSPEGYARAREIAARGLELAPDDPDLHHTLAFVEAISVMFGWSPGAPEGVGLAHHHAERAVAADPRNPIAQHAVSMASFMVGDYERGRQSADLAVDLAPGYSASHFAKANAYLLGGYGLETALEAFDRTIRLSPRDSFAQFHQNNRALCLYMLDRFDEALDGWRAAISMNPDMIWPRFNLAGAFARLGRLDEARSAREDALKIVPAPSLAFYRMGWPFRDPADLEKVLEGQRLAGIEIAD